MNRLKKGIIGLYYLLCHPVTTLRLVWMQKECGAGETFIDSGAFRRKYSDICISFEVFLAQQQLSPSLVTFHNTRTEAWSIDQYETFVLCQIVKSSDSAVIFEIGTFKGQTTYNIKANLPDGGRIHTLDKNQCLTGNENIVPIRGDSLSFDFSPYHNKVDLMFVDGSHEYDYVLSDSEHAFRCVKEGGFIAWHDFIHDRPYVVKAVLNFCHQHNLRPFWIDGTRLAVCNISKK
ncbi:class I SAM-dependent methyltransferase [Chloroflexota bacterium]